MGDLQPSERGMGAGGDMGSGEIGDPSSQSHHHINNGIPGSLAGMFDCN